MRPFLLLFFFLSSLPLVNGQGNMLSPSQMEKRLKELNINTNISQLQESVAKINQNCSAVVISPDGLILTAFHCIADYLPENNWITKGFWAKDRSSEILLPDLSLSIQVEQKNITPEILANIPTNISANERAQLINRNQIQLMLKTSREEGSYYEVYKSMAGNQFVMVRKKSYPKIRLVGFLGKQRINKSILPSPENTVLKDFAILRIEQEKEGSFPFVKLAPTLSDEPSQNVLSIGFPAWTNNNASAVELQYDVLKKLQIQISLDSSALSVLSKYLPAKHEKLATLSQGIKEQKAQIKVLKEQKLIEQKRKQEVARMSQGKIGPSYQNAVQNLENHYQSSDYLRQVNEYTNYSFSQVELFQFTSFLYKLFGKKILTEENFSSFKKSLVFEKIESLESYDLQTIDRALFASMAAYYFSNLKSKYLSPRLLEMVRSTGKDYQKLADLLYQNSLLLQAEQMKILLKKSPQALAEALEQDLSYRFFRQILLNNKTRIQAALQKEKKTERDLRQKYLQQLQNFGVQNQDANGSLRFSPGKIQEIMQVSKGPQEGMVPAILLSNTHNSGGSSGAPLLNRKGELLGIHIQRPINSLLSDYYFDHKQDGSMALSIQWVIAQLEELPQAERILKEINN